MRQPTSRKTGVQNPDQVRAKKALELKIELHTETITTGSLPASHTLEGSKTFLNRQEAFTGITLGRRKTGRNVRQKPFLCTKIDQLSREEVRIKPRKALNQVRSRVGHGTIRRGQSCHKAVSTLFLNQLKKIGRGNFTLLRLKDATTDLCTTCRFQIELTYVREGSMIGGKATSSASIKFLLEKETSWDRRSRSPCLALARFRQ